MSVREGKENEAYRDHLQRPSRQIFFDDDLVSSDLLEPYALESKVRTGASSLSLSLSISGLTTHRARKAKSVESLEC